MKTVLTLLLCTIGMTAFSQTEQKIFSPLELIESKSQNDFEYFSPFTTMSNLKARSIEIEDDISDFKILDLNKSSLSLLEKSAPEALQLELPSVHETGTMILDLVKVDIFTEDFQVLYASNRAPAKVSYGNHYRGIVNGDHNSVVAISVFENEIMGLIATDSGNLVLGKLQNKSKEEAHIIYDDKEVLKNMSLDCATEDDGVVYKHNHLSYSGQKANGDCIRFYIEVDNDIYQSKGGATGTTNYMTGLLNEVITMYANESINSVVSQMILWDVTSPYSSTSSSGMLNDFQANTGTFNGDLGHLFSYQASGGIAAGFSGICNSNPDNSKCFSSINSTYQVVPTYSWSVYVATHEFGHLFGSRHTHACVWNGNGTAIDGCSGSVEGSCSLPGNPSDGGTIMSYCHLTSVGINFNKGFGPQPGNVIRNSVDNATCTVACGPPTCSDGIQNQDETGVDCGGTVCAPCPTCDDGIQNGGELDVDCGGPCSTPCPCNGQDVTLTLVLDSYPGETTWTITNNGLTYASGGPYTTSGATVVEVNCLNDGCYDFNIFDSYGDGICCAYGNGSYSFTDASGNVLASGGEFTFGETTNFCLSSGPSVTVDIINQSDVSCNGNSDGSAEASASNGSAPYTYTWSNGSTGSILSGVSAGVYSVTATDSQGVSGTNSVTISEPAALSVSATGTDISCSGQNDGSASASASGGTGSASYAWSGPNGYTNAGASISNLTEGNYTVVATDANGCTASDLITIEVGDAGSSCDDGDPCTINDVYDSACNCAGTFADSDGDGVCDANDICPGFDDNADEDGDGIPDGCDNNCTIITSNFSVSNLEHSGTGSNSSTLDFGSVQTDVSFDITGLNAVTNGPPANRYIEEVTVSYMDALGNTVIEGVYSGANVSSVSVAIAGVDVLSVSVSLQDIYDGNSSSTMSVTLGSVTSCDSGTCPDDDNDGVCNAQDVCPGFDDTVDSDGDGIPDGCDSNNCTVVSDNFPVNPITHIGGGSTSASLTYTTVHEDVSFTISNLDAVTNGNPSNRYIESVTVSYIDGNNNTIVVGTYNGDVASAFDISIAGEVTELTLTLEDGFDGNTNQNMSVDISPISSCLPGSSLDEGNRKEDITAELNLAKWQVHPNPGGDIIYISNDKLDKDLKSTQVQILVYTLNGDLIAQYNEDKSNRIKLITSELTSGQYIIKLIDNNDVQALKWIKFN